MIPRTKAWYGWYQALLDSLPLFCFCPESKCQVKHLTAQNSLQVRGGMWFILTNEKKWKSAWRINSVFFFFMLKMKTWLATLCLLPLTLLSLWSLDSRLRLVVQRVRRMQTPLCTLYLQILINVKANKNLYLIQPQELDFCYMPLNKILCDTATRGSLQMSVSHYLIVWYS